MASDDDEEESFGSDDDDEFNEDFEALRRACLLAGTCPGDFQKESLSAAAAASLPTVDTRSNSDNDDAGDEDLELVRNIQNRFAIVTDNREPLTLEPLCSIPSGLADKDDNFEDDFETLRAIQRRFAAYSGDSHNDSMENASHKPEHGGITNLSLETSHNLSVESTNAEDHSYMGSINNALNSGSCNKLQTRTGPPDSGQGSDSGDVARLPIKGSSFPKAAEAFVDAIKNNRSCQKLIRSKLVHIESRIEELKELKERVKILKDFQVACRKRTGRALSQKKDARAQLISASKINPSSKLNEKKPSPMLYGPAENSQVAKFREAVEKSPAFMGRAKWSKEENERLVNGLRQQFQEMLLRRSLELLSDGERLVESSGDVDGIVASISDVDITPEKMRLFLPKVNWDYLASLYVSGRSGAECHTRWLNCEDLLINQNSWTSMEDKILLHVVQQKGLSNWIDIATSLGTNRTPFQCLARYQRSLNASIIKREWTEEEDNQLRATVEAFGESNWQIVASAMEGRTGTQCSNRWMKTLHPARQRVGRWTSDEDKRLKVAVMLFGAKNWKKIAEFVPGRTQVQCRERWVNSLDPSLNLKTWTEEEDFKLKEAIEHHGYCWSKVAACIPPRTDSQCRRRWKVLLPHQVPLLRAAREMQKAALISNFVDRESERPALKPNDFVPSQEIICLPESEPVNLSGKQKRGSRRRREDALANPSSGDLCSNEVPGLANGTEGETLTNNLSTKNKRQKIMLKKTKSACSPEEQLSCWSGALESSAANDEDLATSGAVDCCPERDFQDPVTVTSRDMLMSKAAGAVVDVTSDERTREPPCGKDGDSDQVESNFVSLADPDPNSALVTGGKEVLELNRDEESDACHKQASGLYPHKNSCSYGQEEDGGGCNNTEQTISSLTDTTSSMIANLEDVGEVGIRVGAKTWHAEVSELQPKGSGCNESQPEKQGYGDDVLVQKQKQETKSTRTRVGGGKKTQKGSRKRPQILSEDVAVDDESTLAAFCKKKLAAADTRDDDMTLASFCGKLKRRKVKLAE